MAKIKACEEQYNLSTDTLENISDKATEELKVLPNSILLKNVDQFA